MTCQILSIICLLMSFSCSAENLKGYPVENQILFNCNYGTYLDLPGTVLLSKRQVLK